MYAACTRASIFTALAGLTLALAEQPALSKTAAASNRETATMFFMG